MSKIEQTTATDMLTWEQLCNGIKGYCLLFKPLAGAYPELKPYLVLTKGTCQASLPQTPANLWRACPAMVVDNPNKARAMSVIEMLDESVRMKWYRRVAALEKRLEALAGHVLFYPSILVEVRFDVLDFESIWRMQMDELIDRSLTPQGRTSIRIVFGPITRFVSESKHAGPDSIHDFLAATANAAAQHVQDDDQDNGGMPEMNEGRRL